MSLNFTELWLCCFWHNVVQFRQFLPVSGHIRPIFGRSRLISGNNRPISGTLRPFFTIFEPISGIPWPSFSSKAEISPSLTTQS